MSRFPVDKEWFKKKLKESGVSQRKLAALHGFDHGTLSRVLRGEQPLRVDQAVKLSSYFGVSLYEFLHRAGAEPPAVGNTLSVVGVLNGLLEVTPRDMPPVAAITHFAQGVVALICDEPGSQFYGWLYAYIPAVDIQAAAIGRLSVVQLNTGKKLIRFLSPGLHAGRFNLMAFSGRQTFDVEVSAASPVLHIRPAQP